MPVRGSLNGPELVARQLGGGPKNRLVKIALGIWLGIWGVIGAWDLFVSELVPPEKADQWRVSAVVGYFPWWVWLIVVALIVVAASLAYAVVQKWRADALVSLGDKPSIAVLPFVNMTGDHAQDYLSDGITENIITGLSRFRDLSVISSESTFAYKGKALRIQDVASELRVAFVLEGSVQKSSTRVTITAQLIDGLTGAHLWAERFDRNVEDVATVLDDLTEKIVVALAAGYRGRLSKAWRRRAERTSRRISRPMIIFSAVWNAFDFTKGFSATAIKWFEKAIERDPSYGKPYAKIAWAHLVDVWLGWSEDPSFSMAEALKFATAAIQHDDDEAWGYWALAGYHSFGGDHDRAISEYQRALELNPNDADVLNDFGLCLSYAGRATEGVEVVHKAMRLNPHYPDYWVMQLGPIYFNARRYEDAISTLRKIGLKGHD